MHAFRPAGWTTRNVFFTLLVIAALAISSPVAEPEPIPIDSPLAAVIGSNHDLGCQNGCPGAAGAQRLNTNGAQGSSAGPLSVLGGLVLAGGVLASI